MRSARKSAAATSAFVRPVATRSATRRSAGVRPSMRVRPPMRPSSSPRPLRPAGRRRSPRSRRTPPRSPRAPAASAAPAGARRRARAARAPRPNGSPTPRAADCLSERERLVDVAARGGDETAAPRRVRERPIRGRVAGRRLPRVEPADGVVDEAELEQRLDLLGSPPAHVGSRPVGGVAAIRSALREPLHGRLGVPAPELHDPERRGGAAELRRRAARRAGQISLGELARPREVAAVRGDSADGKRFVGDSASGARVLGGELAGLGGVRIGQREPARTELDEREVPERIGGACARPARSSAVAGSRAAARARSRSHGPDRTCASGEAGSARAPRRTAGRELCSLLGEPEAPALPAVEAHEREPGQARRREGGRRRAPPRARRRRAHAPLPADPPREADDQVEPLVQRGAERRRRARLRERLALQRDRAAEVLALDLGGESERLRPFRPRRGRASSSSASARARSIPPAASVGARGGRDAPARAQRGRRRASAESRARRARPRRSARPGLRQLLPPARASFASSASGSVGREREVTSAGERIVGELGEAAVRTLPLVRRTVPGRGPRRAADA